MTIISREDPALLAPFGLPPLLDPDNLTADHPSLAWGDRIDAVCAAPTASLYPEPDLGTEVQSQVLYGEPLQVLDRADGWQRVISLMDGYIGWMQNDGLKPFEAPPTHRVGTTLTHRYRGADIKSGALGMLPFGGFVTVTGGQSGKFLPTADGWIVAKHVVPLGLQAGDALTAAKMFLGTPYLWGGRSCLGVDCSGLVQLALAATGQRVHRDSGTQFRTLGRALEDGEQPMAGDLAFFPGHVGFMVDASNLLHANATHMRVTIDPLDEVTSWVARDGHTPAFTGFRRLSTP